MNVGQSIGIILTVAVCTLFTRALPFLFFSRKASPPKAVQYLGRVLPPAVMAALVIYCLKNIQFTAMSGFLPQLIAVVIVALLHIWKRNNLLSILGGTACYMLMIQLGLF